MRDKLICLFSSLNILLFSFLLLNAQALSTIHAFDTPHPTHQNLDSTLLEVQRNILSLQGSPQITPNKQENEVPTIFIPRLNIISPIFTATTEDSPSDLLQKGVLSLTPYSPTEQTIIFGHSSDYLWNDNPFGTVFTLIPELQIGDLIKIFFNRQSHTYRITETLITEPNLEPLISTSENHLILSTCYPIGFWSQRYNVIAEPLTSSL